VTHALRLGISGLGQSVFAAQAIDAAEFAEVRSNHDQTAAARMPGDQQVISADRLAAPLQRHPDLRRMRRGVGIERQYLEPRREALDL